MTAHWYVYYKVAERDVADCVAAANSLLEQVREQHAGVRAELLRRPGVGSDGHATLMEVYTGLDDDTLAEVEARAQAALARWTVGARHAERFVPCAG